MTENVKLNVYSPLEIPFNEMILLFMRDRMLNDFNWRWMLVSARLYTTATHFHLNETNKKKQKFNPAENCLFGFFVVEIIATASWPSSFGIYEFSDEVFINTILYDQKNEFKVFAEIAATPLSLLPHI